MPPRMLVAARRDVNIAYNSLVTGPLVALRSVHSGTYSSERSFPGDMGLPRVLFDIRRFWSACDAGVAGVRSGPARNQNP